MTGFDVEVVEALAEELADKAGDGNTFRAEPESQPEFSPRRIQYRFEAQRVLGGES